MLLLACYLRSPASSARFACTGSACHGPRSARRWTRRRGSRRRKRPPLLPYHEKRTKIALQCFSFVVFPTIVGSFPRMYFAAELHEQTDLVELSTIQHATRLSFFATAENGPLRDARHRPGTFCGAACRATNAAEPGAAAVLATSWFVQTEQKYSPTSMAREKISCDTFVRDDVTRQASCRGA